MKEPARNPYLHLSHNLLTLPEGNLLSVSKVIEIAKKKGSNFGKGNPYHRLRYYTKIGLLPHMYRMKEGPQDPATCGHYPSWVIERLLFIQNLKSKGYSNKLILEILNSPQVQPEPILLLRTALSKLIRIVSLGLFSFLFIVGLIILLQKISLAAINEEINYQGKLTDQNYDAVSDGEYQMTFRIYDAAAGGSTLYDEFWTDANTCNTTINGSPTGGSTTTVPYTESGGNCATHGTESSWQVGQIVCNLTDKTCTEITAVNTSGNTITVAGNMTTSPFSWANGETISNQPAAINGIFSVRIGSLNPSGDPVSNVNFNQDLWLGVTVEADSEMVPRRKLASVPSAETADKLDNIDSASFLRSDTSDNFTSGTLTTDAGTTLDVNGDLSIADTSIALDGASTNLAVTGDFSINTDDIFVEKSTGEVGIGTSNPSEALDIIGNLEIDDDDTTGKGIILEAADRPLITRGWDAFTSGSYNGIGRWGMFMESSTLTLGIPNSTPNYIKFRAFNADSTGTDLMSIRYDGKVGIGIADAEASLEVNDGTIMVDRTSDDWANEANRARINFFDGNFEIGTGEVTEANSIVGISTGDVLYLAAFSGAGRGIVFKGSDDTIFQAIETTTGNTYFKGNVGLGAANPGVKLDIYTGNTTGSAIDSATNAGLRIIDDNSGVGSRKGLIFYNSSSFNVLGAIETNVVAGWDTHMDFIIKKDGTLTKVLHLDESGNVGIGETSPAAKLEVAQTDAANDEAIIIDTEETTSTQDVFKIISDVGGDETTVFNIDAGGSLTASDVIFNPKASATATEGRVYYDSDDDNLYVYTTAGWVDLTVQGGSSNSISQGDSNVTVTDAGDGYITFTEDNSEIMRVSGGYLGIGTTPSSILHVQAATPRPRLAWTNTANYGSFDFYESSTFKGYIGGIGSTYTTADRQNDIEIYAQTGDISLWPGAAQAVTIKSGGRVGIGTTNPGSQLNVVYTAVNNDVFLLQDLDGTCEAWPASTGLTWACSSDERLKTNIRTPSPTLDYISRIPLSDYTLIKTGDNVTGPIAQHLLERFPELVQMGDDGYWQVSELSSWKLVKGIQELDERTRGLGSLGQGDVIINQGNVGIGTTNPNEKLDVEGEIEFDIDTANDTTIGVCKDLADGNTDVEFRECNGTPGDIAEFYAAQADLRPGDVVSISYINNKPTLIKTTKPYETEVLGVVSTYPVGQFGKPLGHKTVAKDDFPTAIALVGKVPTKVSTINGSIKAGDPLTPSDIPGVVMKAKKAGKIIGYALEPFDGRVKVSRGVKQQENLREKSVVKFNLDPIDPKGDVGKILISVNLTYYLPDISQLAFESLQTASFEAASITVESAEIEKAVIPALTTESIASEWQVEPSSAFDYGMLVSLDENGLAALSSKEYDDQLLGVTRGTPSLETGNIQVVFAGKSLVKISPLSEPIKIGDFLTSSSDSGKAIKANGLGFTLGRALEEWTPTSDKEEILVSISLGFADPTSDKDNNSIDSNATSQNDSLQTETDNLQVVTPDKDSNSINAVSLGEGLKLDSLEAKEATISDRLNVLGDSLLSNLQLTGNLSVGLITLNEDTTSISSIIEPLKIQPNFISSNGDEISSTALDILSGKLTIDTEGNLKINEGVIYGNNSFRNAVRVKPEQLEVRVSHEWRERPVTINTTPTWDTRVWLTDIDNTGFTINFSDSPITESKVFYLAIW